jgi:hypothetical protein
VLGQRRGGARADRGDGRAGRARGVEPGARQRLEEQRDAVGAGQADQRVVADPLDRRRTSSLSIRGSIRIAGSSTTSAPSARRVAARPLAWARARVTTTRRPCSGRRSSQRALAPRDHRADDDQRRGADSLALDRLGERAQRRATVRWPAIVPRSIAAAGSPGRGPPRSARRRSSPAV